MVPMSSADSARGADGTNVFCTFKHFTHMLHKVKHRCDPTISRAPLYRMDTREWEFYSVRLYFSTTAQIASIAQVMLFKWVNRLRQSGQQ